MMRNGRLVMLTVVSVRGNGFLLAALQELLEFHEGDGPRRGQGLVTLQLHLAAHEWRGYRQPQFGEGSLAESYSEADSLGGSLQAEGGVNRVAERGVLGAPDDGWTGIHAGADAQRARQGQSVADLSG